MRIRPRPTPIAVAVLFGGDDINWLLRVLGKTVDAAPLTTPYVGDTATGERGSLTVVETDGSFDADGTKIDFTAQSTPAWSGQYMRDADGQTRVRGLMGVGRIIINDRNKRFIAGLWNDAIADSAGAQAVHSTTSSFLNVMNENTLVIATGISLTNGDQIDWLVIARATGSYVLASINDGNWQLLWWFDTDSTATLYAGFSNFDADGSVNLIGSVVAPENLVPSPVVSDNYSLIPDIVDSGSNGLDGTPVRVGLDGSAGHSDSINSYIQLPAAAMDSAGFDEAEFTVISRQKYHNADSWSGDGNRLFKIGVDSNNRALVWSNAANQLEWFYAAGGTAVGVGKTGVSTLDYFTTIMSVSKIANEMKAFYNGVQQGTTQTGLGTWAGTINDANAVILAATNTPTNVAPIQTSDFIYSLNGAIISDANAAAVTTKLDAGTLTNADLNGYFGTGNWAWYKIDEQYITDGAAHLEADGHGSGKTRDGRTWSSEGNKRYNGAVGGAQLLADNDMEAVGVAAWYVGIDTLTKETGTPHGGAQVLRVAHAASVNPFGQQAVLTIGKYYSISFWARSDGVAIPQLALGGKIETGTTSTSWQLLVITGVATSTDVRLRSITSTGTEYTEWDDGTLVEHEIADLLDLTNTNQTNHYAATNATIIDNTPGGVGVAWDSAKANGIPVYYDRVSDEVVAEKWIAGVFDSEIMRVAKTYNAAATLKVSFTDIDADGTYNLTVWYDDAFVATVTVSDVEIVGNTYAGEFGFLEGGFAEKEIVMKSNEGTLYTPHFAGVT